MLSVPPLPAVDSSRLRGAGLALGSAELAMVLSLLQTRVVSFLAQLHVVIFPGRPGSEVPGTQTVEPAGIPDLLVPQKWGGGLVPRAIQPGEGWLY